MDSGCIGAERVGAGDGGRRGRGGEGSDKGYAGFFIISGLSWVGVECGGGRLLGHRNSIVNDLVTVRLRGVRLNASTRRLSIRKSIRGLREFRTPFRSYA